MRRYYRDFFSRLAWRFSLAVLSGDFFACFFESLVLDISFLVAVTSNERAECPDRRAV